MQLTVIGAGAIGSAVVAHLCEQEEVSLVQVCEAHARSLETLHERVESPKLRSFQVDARDSTVIDSILEGSACVIGCADPGLNISLARCCADMGIHYCDLGGQDELVTRELALDDQAREASVWILPGCGLAPGLINVLCLLGIEQFETVDAVHLRVGEVPVNPEPPFNFRLTWSADKILNDYTQPVQLIEDGEVRAFDSLSRRETIHFDPPFGEMEAFCTAGGLSTLTRQLKGRVRTLDHKTIRWPGHAEQMRFILGLGFGEDRIIDVRTHLTYREVLMRRMRERLGGRCEDAVLLRVVIHGQKDGRNQTLVYEMVDHFDARHNMTAIERCTSIPAATVALTLAAGALEGGGAAPPENVLPKETYYKTLIDQGLAISEKWHDGYVGATRTDGELLDRE